MVRFTPWKLEREFIAAGHELSPLNLPLDSFSRGPRVFRAGDSPFDGGLPRLIADSLPDSWGARMLRVEVPGLQTTLGKLAAIGERGPGGITFEPVLGKGADDESVSTHLGGLARDAAQLAKTPAVLTPGDVNAALARGGGSLGGAQPKVAAHLPASGDFQQLQHFTHRRRDAARSGAQRRETVTARRRGRRRRRIRVLENGEECRHPRPACVSRA
jgi:serine/threonine-protein kinase HipA